jgi:hypothetical protein
MFSAFLPTLAAAVFGRPRAMGGGRVYTTMRHLLPNSLGPIVVAITFGVPRAIFAEAALSYIGIGIKPPTPSWGSMIQDGYSVIFASPTAVIVPAKDGRQADLNLLLEDVKDALGKDQVARTGYGEEFGQALDEPQDQGADQRVLLGEKRSIRACVEQACTQAPHLMQLWSS